MIFLDKRAGSVNLRSYLQFGGVQVEMGQWTSDVEFCGAGPEPDVPLIIGVEYKTVEDCLTAMTDGRLTGTQLANMQKNGVGRLYLCVEGPLRFSDDGVLETKHYHPAKKQYYWGAAHGRGGEGWTSREFWGRLMSLEEFVGLRIKFTYSIHESAAWLIALYKWWQKPYSEHSSYKQWDQSRDSGPRLNRGNILIPTSDLPLVQRMAREISNVGQLKAGYVGQHFKTPAAMILGLDPSSAEYQAMRALVDRSAWTKVGWEEQLKKGGHRTKHFGKESIAAILKELWEE